MINDIIKRLTYYVLTGGVALAIASQTSASADDIFKGVSGPTNLQLDERVIYSENNNGVKISTNNLILKYWDYNELGKWIFIVLPYKFIDSPTKSNNGFGDISIGLGPRGIINNFHWLSYGALIFPTGSSDGKIPLGNGRFDKKLGMLITYHTSDKKFHIDGALEYNFTGRNKEGIDTPNEVYSGLLFGGKITNEIRIAIGLTDLVKENGDFLLNLRFVARYTFSQKSHLELIMDKSIDSKNIPKANNIGMFFRYNF